MLELHCHTTYSDGTLTPAELVRAAAIAGVCALAITDHDTIAGWDEAIATAQTVDPLITIIPGVELSVVHKGKSLHLLGFYPERDRIQSALEQQRQGRRDRIQHMAAKLAQLGYPLDLSAILDNPTLSPGRPHLAQALVQAGYVDEPQQAFDRWIGEKKAAYVPQSLLSVREGLALLRQANAVTSWAHPCLFRAGNIETMLPAMIAAGLNGLEVHHPSHSPRQRERLQALCIQWQLLQTGGSDYHGPAQEAHHPLNCFALPLDLLSLLQQRRSSDSIPALSPTPRQP